ncbi:DUF554 domain-containing protein [Romboutsia weinsteinii]|uniref:DUF554 domain-containing protein n=1 Tax=Romboutsia weinsteinii TaxID=2020949 RepID=A0A371IZL1_9FIRM|nr:DUF554 domain-containing protein [Romboutsia weinsteinii]RDY25883.1 DUF554 domain-containing protein [Romboutsia weinsteinii]
MFGVTINSLTIALGCLIGLVIKGGIPEKLSTTIMNALALCVLYIGISGALEGTNTLITIISMAVGALIGELIDIDKWLNNLGIYIEKKFTKQDGKVSISQGFVSSSLLFCVGAMSVVGALDAGLLGNNETLLAKSILDGITSVIFTATFGIGVIFSSISVFLYQGSIALGASFLSGLLSTEVVNSMTSVGSLLIVALGLNMLKVTNIKVANLLPAMFLPILFGIANLL